MPPTPWPPYVSRVNLEPELLDWYADFFDFCGLPQYPTRDSLFLPDVVLSDTTSGAPASASRTRWCMCR